MGAEPRGIPNQSNWTRSQRDRLSDKNLYSYLNELAKNAPLFCDTGRIAFFRLALEILRDVDVNTITQQTAFFHAISNSVWMCPKDVDTVNNYLSQHRLQIRTDIALAIVNLFTAIVNAFKAENATYGDNGTTIALTKETHEAIINMVTTRRTYDQDDLYLKLRMLRDNIYLARKRFSSLTESSLISGNANLYKYVMDIDAIKHFFLSTVHVAHTYDLDNAAHLLKDTQPEKLRMPILAMECLLELLDYTRGVKYASLFQQRFNEMDFGYFGRMPEWIRQNDRATTARNWISTLPSVEPACAITISKVRKYENMRQTINPPDIESPTIQYLVLLYQALAEDSKMSRSGEDESVSVLS